MNKIKDRCMWFIGMDRLTNAQSNGKLYTDFMYSDSDIVLFSRGWDFQIYNKSSEMVVGDKYTIGKRGVKNDWNNCYF